MDGRTPFEMDLIPGLDRADDLPENSPAFSVNVLHTTPDTDTIELPGGGAFLSAEFSRDGFDLLLDAGADGQVLIPDYFQLENPPSLKTQDGAVLSPGLVQSLAGPMAPAQTAQIAIDGTQPTQTDAVTGEPIGTVTETEGQVTVLHPNGVQEVLNVGAPIFQGDVLETGSDGSVNVVFVDDTVFTLDVDGRMVIDEMVYDPDTQTGAFNAQIVKGVFSMVSGQVAKTSPDGMTLDTPASTIGIRGSTLVIEMGEDGSIQNATLVRDVDGNIGEIVLVSPTGDSVVLNQFGASTSVSADGSVRPVQILSEQEVQQAHAKVLTKVVRTVARQAEQKAQQAQEKAEQSEAEAQAKQEEAEAAEQEAEAAQQEAEAAQQEAAAAQAEAEAALAEAEAAGDEEAIAEAQAQAAAAAEAAAEAEAAAQQAEAAAAQAQAAQQEAAQAQAQAQAAAQQAQQAQSFSSLANTAAVAQAEAEQAVIQQQGTQDGPGDGPTPDGGGEDGPGDEGDGGNDGNGGDPAATAETAETAIEELPPEELPPEEPLPGEPLPGEGEGDGELLPPPDPTLTDDGNLLSPTLTQDGTQINDGTNDPLFATTTPTNTNTQPPPPNPDANDATEDNTGPINTAPTVGGSLSASLVYGATITLNVGATTHLSASDADGDTLTYKLQALPSYGSIQLNGTALPVGGSFTQAALNNGQVKYVHDNSASVSDNFKFVVFDGTANSSLSTFTFQTAAWPAGTYTNPVGTYVSIADYTTSSTGLVNNGTVNAVSGAISNFATISNAGTINVSPDSAANMSMLASSSVANSGTVNISSSLGSNLQVDFGGSSIGVGATNNGTINVLDTGIVYSSKLGGTWTNNGTINVNTDLASLTIDNVINNGVINIIAGGGLDIASASTPTFNSGSSIQGGDTTGHARFGWSSPANITYDGIFNPGTNGTVGNLLMDDGNSLYVDMGNTAVYNVDIATTGTAGVNYDLLSFSSGVTMNGTLNLNAIGGYSPTSGDTFAPLTYSSGLGASSFTTITHNFGAGWVVVSDYGATALNLTVLSSAAATTGTSGNDTLASSASNETIDGGAGTDTLHLNGALSNYTFSFAADGTLTLTDTGSTDGTDTISNVETLQFVDTSVSLTSDQPEQIVNTTTSGNQFEPQITMLSSGGWIVTWYEDGGSIKGQMYDVGGIEVGSELTLASSVAGSVHSVIEMHGSNSTDSFALAYTGTDGNSDDGVFYKVFDSSGSATLTETALNTTTTSAQNTPSIVEHNDGGVFAVWTDQSSGNAELIGRFMNSGGTADSNGYNAGAEFTLNTSTTNDQTNAQAINLDNGSILVTWQSTHQTYSTVMGRIYDHTNNTWGSEFTIADVSSIDSGWAAVDDLSNDNIAVTWLEETGTPGVYDVKAGIMDSSGSLVVSAYTVASGIDLTSNSEHTPGIAGLEDGGFVVTWVDKSASTYDIKAAIYDNAGAVVKSAFTVNTTTTDTQFKPKVEETVDGGFVVTWQSNAQDGDQLGIYAMRFNTDGNQVGETTLTGTAAVEDFTFTSQQDGVIIDGVGGSDTVTLGGVANEVNFIKVSNVITLTGGAADDLVMIGNAIASNSMTIDLGAGEDAIKLADGGNTQTFTNVEAVIGGTGADDVTISTALAASDNAFMEGGDGADTLNLSSAGNNTLEIEGFEIVTGGSMTDTWTSEWGVDLRGVTVSGIENITLDTDNNDSSALHVGSGTAINSALTLTGTGSNDFVYSQNSANLINVTLSGIEGIYFGQDGASAETLTLSSATLPAGLTIAGNGNDDIIQMGASTLDLSSASVSSISSILGTASNDTLTLNNISGVTIDLGAGSLDALYLANGGNSVTVNNTEEIYGGTGTDAIVADANVSTISGGAGADSLTGGAGADIFVYTTPTDSVIGSMDTITDFVAGTDQIDIVILGSMTVASGVAGALSTGDTFVNLTDGTLNALINSATGSLGTKLTGDSTNSEAILLRTSDSQDVLAIDVDANGTIDANDTVINVTNIDTTTALSSVDFV